MWHFPQPRVRACVLSLQRFLPNFPQSHFFFFNITRITVKSRITEGMGLGNVHVDLRGVALVWGYLR